MQNNTTVTVICASVGHTNMEVLHDSEELKLRHIQNGK